MTARARAAGEGELPGISLIETFYFHHPNGIRLQIELKTKLDENSLEGDPDPVPYVRELLQRG